MEWTEVDFPVFYNLLIHFGSPCWYKKAAPPKSEFQDLIKSPV
jgi:hypothetical protein